MLKIISHVQPRNILMKDKKPMSAKKSITTKKGDQGYTRLYSGERVLKNSPRVDLCGDLDELNCLLGIARLNATSKEIKDELMVIQRTLFIVSTEIMVTFHKASGIRERLDKKILEKLEKKCALLEMKVETPGCFVIPANSLPAAYLDCARAVSRRCERKMVGLIQKKQIRNQILLIWLNRLSDYLYLMARYEEAAPVMAKG